MLRFGSLGARCSFLIRYVSSLCVHFGGRMGTVLSPSLLEVASVVLSGLPLS